ncbi:MAG: YggT family protein [Deltaproteobacteria bacterium]|nr:YggT family protein [Deltaproteobacteria bacterium]
MDFNLILLTFGRLIYYGSFVYIWLIILRVLLTWINPNPYTPVMRFLARVADPVLVRARRLVPFTLGGLDFSPVLALIVISFAGSVLGKWLMLLGSGPQSPSLLFILAVGELLSLIQSLLWLIIILMFIRLLMSLVRPSPYNIIVRIVFGLTEPLLAPLRRAFPPGPGGLDFRPLVFLLILLLVQLVLLGSLVSAY